MKKLRIAQIAPLWIPIPPRTYGGIELMLHNLTEELVKRGHDTTLFASGDSQTSARLIAITEQALWLGGARRSQHAPIIRMIKEVSDRRGEFDLLHNHFNFFSFPLSLHPDFPPLLSTVHRPVDKEYAEAMKSYSGIKFVAISRDQKQHMEEYGIAAIDVIPNGIEVHRYEWNAKPQDYLFYLGRLNQEKGIMNAIEVARRAGEKLVIAGNSAGREEALFFLHELRPLLDSRNIIFEGQVDFNEKVKLLKNAKALLFPIERREPFGLVMIESLACGTPVIAFRQGSVPEIIEHGKTGFVVDTKEEMIEAIRHIPEIDRGACRRIAEEKFTLDRMVNRYEELYHKLI